MKISTISTVLLIAAVIRTLWQSATKICSVNVLSHTPESAVETARRDTTIEMDTVIRTSAMNATVGYVLLVSAPVY